MKVTKAAFLGGVVALMVGSSSAAQAGLLLGADVYGAKAIGTGTDNFGIGYGFNGRLGYMLPIPVIDLSAEVVVGMTKFGGDVPTGTSTVSIDNGIIRAMAGGRAAIGAGFKPFAYWHIGYARRAISGAGLDASGSSLATQFGGGLDFTALPLLTIGIQAGYSYLTEGDVSNSAGATAKAADAQWIEFGAHASIGF